MAQNLGETQSEKEPEKQKIRKINNATESAINNTSVPGNTVELQGQNSPLSPPLMQIQSSQIPLGKWQFTALPPRQKPQETVNIERKRGVGGCRVTE